MSVSDRDRVLAKWAYRNAFLIMREAQGELEPWEVCTCSASGNPPWHDHSCPRDAADGAACWLNHIDYRCRGCDYSWDLCWSIKPPAIKCCPDCSHERTESEP